MSDYIIQEAIFQAEKSWHNSFRHGAILKIGKRTVSLGYNKPIISNLIFNSIHAEMSAIINAKPSLRKLRSKQHNFVMYVVRINKDSKLCLSKPCIHCQKIMKTFGVHKCIYSNDCGKLDVIYF